MKESKKEGGWMVPIVQLMGGWFDTQLTLGDIDKIVLCDYPLLLTFKQLAQDLYPKRF